MYLLYIQVPLVYGKNIGKPLSSSGLIEQYASIFKHTTIAPRAYQHLARKIGVGELEDRG